MAYFKTRQVLGKLGCEYFFFFFFYFKVLGFLGGGVGEGRWTGRYYQGPSVVHLKLNLNILLEMDH